MIFTLSKEERERERDFANLYHKTFSTLIILINNSMNKFYFYNFFNTHTFILCLHVLYVL